MSEKIKIPLIFRWRRNPFSLFIFFLFLSLVAHICFFSSVQLTPTPTPKALTNSAPVFILSNESSPEIAKFLDLARLSSPYSSHPITLTSSLEEIKIPLSAGLSSALSKIDFAIPPDPPGKESTQKSQWVKNSLPFSEFSLPETPLESEAKEKPSDLALTFAGAQGNLKPEENQILQMPIIDVPETFAYQEMKFLVSANAFGQSTHVVPIKTMPENDFSQQASQWLQSFRWKPSDSGTSGIITLIWTPKP